MTRFPLAVAAAGALALSFAAGMAVAGPDRGPARELPGPGPEGVTRVNPASYNQDLAPADDCDDLLAWYVRRGVRAVGPYGWDGPVLSYAIDGAMRDGVAVVAQAAGASEVSGAPVPQRATSSTSGTNVQEVGVDEPDVVKTDGELLVRVQDGRLVTYDVGREPERLASIPLAGVRDPELLLAGDRVVVTGSRRDGQDPGRPPSTRVLVVDVSDAALPVVVDDATYDTDLVTARLHGTVESGTVRLVLAAPLPDLDFVKPRRWLRSPSSAEEHNRGVVRDSEIEDWLPTVTRDGDTEPLLRCDEVAIPTSGARLGTLAVVAFDAEDPAAWEASGVATDSRTTYFSAERMVLATSGASGWGGWWGTPTVDSCCWPRTTWSSGSGVSRLYSFALDGTRTTFVASGRVEGAIADRWAMDVADGTLRVAVGETHRTGNFNSVVTFEEEGDTLVEVGRLDHLGDDEDIQSVRWFDDLAFVVTFRQVDPLYAVDLTDATRPRLLGELKIPGFSEYLHPLGRHRLLGIGQGPGERGRWGAQAGLFNITDLGDLKRKDVLSYAPGTQAGVAVDPRQLTWLPASRTLLTVITEGWTGRTGWVSVLTLDGGPIENRMVEVEHGADVSDVRTVPLPDGRVVLVTGEDVSSFEL